MKYNKIFSSLLLASAVAFSFSLQSCKDQPDEFELTGGTPTIDYIRPAKATFSFSLQSWKDPPDEIDPPRPAQKTHCLSRLIHRLPFAW